jgi:hypothetical protein
MPPWPPYPPTPLPPPPPHPRTALRPALPPPLRPPPKDSGSMAFEENGERIDDLKMIAQKVSDVTSVGVFWARHSVCVVATCRPYISM